ncbi:MAG TPA: DUF120 domain-containing protein [archaeon]|nr:DUF120 domain-containing protein [archaeon]
MEILKGKIVSGIGVAGNILKDYLPIFKEKLKTVYFQGTLNLELEEEFEMPENSEYIEPFTKEDGTKRGGLRFARAKIKNLPVLIVKPDLTKHPKNIVEIMAPINIKKQYGLKDGDYLEVHI